ncbi:MAG TPA: hypothetical protein DEH02_21820, partial [Bacteroidales bacterium]|nr:hypothetical protein [Bacteroidales bacterium]
MLNIKTKIMKQILFAAILSICSIALQAQPQNLFANFGVIWNDYSMTDRGSVSAVTVQSPNTGTAQFVFNKAASDWSEKWCGSTTNYTRSLNQKLSEEAYYFTSGTWDHNIEFAMTTSNYYTFIVGENATANNDLSILETTFNPVTISATSQYPAAGNIGASDAVNVSATLSASPSSGEYLFIRYTTDNWASSSFAALSQFMSTTYAGTIPAQAAGTIVKYYILSTINNTPDVASIDYFTLNLLNNNNANYEYTVGGADSNPPSVLLLTPQDNATNIATTTDLTIFFDENIQKGTGNILVKKVSDNSTVQTIDVTSADVVISNTQATININALLSGTEYYINVDAGTFKDIANNDFSGITDATSWTFTTIASVEEVDWCNLQWPASATNSSGQSYYVYAQVYEDGITQGAGAGAGIEAWIGYSTLDVSPSFWTDWQPASYYGESVNNDEFRFDLGTHLTTAGTYYVASRFSLNGGSYKYGAYSSTGGGFWDGAANLSATFTVTAVDATAPLITNFSPADNSSGVLFNTDLILTFDENVQKGTGNIIVHKLSDNSVVETIDITSTTVTVLNNVVTVVISPLSASTEYYIKVESGAIKDMSDN